MSSRRAPYQSSGHAARNFASWRSWRVLRRWQLRHNQCRLSGVNALSIAAGPSARATPIARRWSISSDGSPHISQSVCWIFLWMLAGCDAVCVQAVGMPACLDMRGAFVAPATDAVSGWLSPSGGAVDEPSGMLCRMPSVVQHEAPELALSDVSSHGLPRPLKLLG